MPTIETVIGAIILGIVYGCVGFVSKRDKDDGGLESFNIRKFLRTQSMYVAAALIVVYGGGSLTGATIEAQVPAAAFVGTLFDMVYPEIKSRILGV